MLPFKKKQLGMFSQHWLLITCFSNFIFTIIFTDLWNLFRFFFKESFKCAYICPLSKPKVNLFFHMLQKLKYSEARGIKRIRFPRTSNCILKLDDIVVENVIKYFATWSSACNPINGSNKCLASAVLHSFLKHFLRAYYVLGSLSDVCVLSQSVDPWTVAHQAPLSV